MAFPEPVILFPDCFRELDVEDFTYVPNEISQCYHRTSIQEYYEREE